MKKLLSGAVVLLLAVIFMCINNEYANTYADDEALQTGTITPYTVLTDEELTENMGAGWNLGNTMDGHAGLTPDELVWQHVETTKELIRSVHDLGFNTIRIPVTWGTMINDDFSIKEGFISRVQDIVDYCVSLDMYVIINMHHDGSESTGWIQLTSDNFAYIQDKYQGAWKTIAERFCNYDEHLLFESMNEVKGTGYSVLEENKLIMQLNQVFVDTVRASGGNNGERWLIVPGKYNHLESVCNDEYGFEMPVDSVDNRIMLSVHYYRPNSFCFKHEEDGEDTDMSLLEMQNIQNALQPLYDKYVSKGIPVLIGEYGCVNKSNTAERAYYFECINRIFQQYGLVGVAWDQGWYDLTEKNDYSFTIIERTKCEPLYSEITDAIMRGFFLKGEDDLSDITKSPETVKINDISLSENELSLCIGDTKAVNAEVTPAVNNDVLVWKTDNESVASVYNGKISAKGAGTATITVFSLSGSVEKSITVTVTDAEYDNAEITTSVDSYELDTDEYIYIDSEIVTTDNADYVYYQSEDESVVTVSSIGKVLAVGEGTTSVDICTASGARKQIEFVVSTKEVPHEIELCLNIFYKNSELRYFSTEISKQTVTVDKNGQYTLTFDCSTDLSASAVNAGITDFSAIRSIYIKDYAITTGERSLSPLKSCDIKYDSITINGKEMTITDSKYVSAINKYGMLSTDGPINVSEESVIGEVSTEEGTAFSIEGAPVTIAVTFTIDNLVFEDGYEPANDEESNGNNMYRAIIYAVAALACIILASLFVHKKINQNLEKKTE